MTQQNLDSLDAELKAGSITDEDYMQALVDEVIRLHPDIDAYEVDNMVRLQLKSLAVEEQYCADIEERQQNVEIGTTPAKKENDSGAKQDSNGDEKAAASQEENGSEARSESSEAESTSDAKKDGNEQSQETSESGDENSNKKDSSDTKSVDDADGNEESKSEGKDEDGDKSPEDNDGDKEDKSDSNDGQGGNECWWTWQIVPGWLTLGTKEN